MFKDRSFNLAFFISVLWHLFLMFAITIVVLPVNLKIVKTTTVSFLGPILEKTAFEMMLNKKEENKGVFFEQPKYARSDFSTYAQNAPLSLKFNTAFSMVQKEGGEGTQGLLADYKVLPPPSGAVPGEERPAEDKGPSPAVAEDAGFYIEGPPAQRGVLYKPALPDISPRIGSSQRLFSVKLKFEVLPDGRVDEVSPLVSSGYPDIDLAAMGFLREIRFSPLRESGDSGPVWGNARLSLEAR